MTEHEFLKEYCAFVDSVTSSYSKDDDVCRQKLDELSQCLNGNFSRLDTAISGIAGEAGEIADVWKKIKFHGKTFAEKREDLISELGDMYWYLAQASMALNVPMEEIIKSNVKKLKARHPDGHFSNAYMKK